MTREEVQTNKLDGYNRRNNWFWNSKDNQFQDDYRCDDRGPSQRPKLNLTFQTTTKEDDLLTSQSSCATSTLGNKACRVSCRTRRAAIEGTKETEVSASIKTTTQAPATYDHSYQESVYLQGPHLNSPYMLLPDEPS
ncbi:hypothetical protein H920_15982 [Fukomys damarensis]|uniref:Uncharacterized protein n=1 Tax=Fukomys damarensis TaxID=885580 RepID=A0A091DIM8_FUKDA|nr:hypothetical protein H920_15982 [Fukomys damarensis]